MTAIAGPSMLTTLRGLLPVPFRKFPAFLTEMTARYGNVLAFALPWRSYVFVNDPEAIKEILVTQQHAFSKSLGTRVLRLLLGEGLLTSEDPLHRQMRRIVQPAFHRERIAQYERVMERDAQEFVERLRPGEVFDAYEAMTELTLRIATETLFGSDASYSAAAVRDALRLMMHEFPYMLTPVSALRQHLPLPNTVRFWRARRTLDAIVFGLIRRRAADWQERSDALSLLLSARNDEMSSQAEMSSREEMSSRAESRDIVIPSGVEGPTSDEQIRDEIMTLFVAGHETTANALVWSLVLLAENPAVAERAAAAARAGDQEYLLRVVKEVLRLYPPAWIIGRESLRDVTVAGGARIPAGATVFLAPLLLHRRPEFFPEPQRFDPDRWLGEPPPPFAYIPFGGGARRCIGEEFAWRETTIVLEALLRAYRFELAGPTPQTAPLVTLRPAGPVPMRTLFAEGLGR